MAPEWIAFYVLWLVPACLRTAILVVMLRRKLHQEFPVFFAYTTFHVLRSGILLYLIHGDPWVYHYSRWAAEAISVGLGFAVIYEILGQVLRPYDAIRGLGRKLFLWVAGLLLLAAAVSAAGIDINQDHDALMAWIYAVGRSLRIVQCGLLGFLLLFSAYFGITWRHRVFGIALGLGLYASVELAATAVRSEVGWIGDDTYSLVTRLAYACATLIWAAYLLRPEPTRVAVDRVPQTQVEQWNQALQEMWQR
jgi:hypothetical protein